MKIRPVFSTVQITKFLNEFEVSVRYKLSSLAERVSILERHLEFCETAVVKHQEEGKPPAEGGAFDSINSLSRP